MRTSFLKLLLMAATVTVMLTGCKKDTSTTDDYSGSAEDASSVSTALNSTTDDATTAVGNTQGLSGKTDGINSLCNVTIDTTQRSSGIVTITFTGTDCSGKVTRSGSITATLLNFSQGTRWKDAGATLQLVFNAVTVTSTTGAHPSVTLNGTHYITNVNGGLAWRVMGGLDQTTAGMPVIHKHSADNFTLTLADGSVRTWSVRRSRSFSNINGVKAVTLSGDTTVNGISGIETWGTNRNNVEFYNAFQTDITANSTCGFLRPVSGEYTHHVANRTLDILFGVDNNGDPVSSGCATSFKITYTRGNKTLSKVVPYWF